MQVSLDSIYDVFNMHVLRMISWTSLDGAECIFL